MSDNVAEKNDSLAVLHSNLPAIRNDLLDANHGLVRSSESAMALAKIQKYLDDTPEEPEAPGILASAKNKAEMEAAIVKVAPSSNRNRSLQTWTTEEPNSFLATFLLFASVVTASSVSLIAGGESGSHLLLFLGLVGLIFSIVIPVADINTHLPFSSFNIRNKVIKRKAYKRELERLVGEAEEVRDRYDRLRGVRKAKIEAAKSALAPWAQEFSLANPGKTLSITGGASRGKLSISSIKDERYSEVEAIAAMLPNRIART